MSARQRDEGPVRTAARESEKDTSAAEDLSVQCAQEGRGLAGKVGGSLTAVDSSAPLARSCAHLL